MRGMVEMLSAVNSGHFRPTAPRDNVFAQPGHELHIKDEFEAEIGRSISDLLNDFYKRTSFNSHQQEVEVTARFARIACDLGISTTGMVQYLTPHEDVHLGGVDAGAVKFETDAASSDDSSSSSSDSSEEREVEASHAVLHVVNGSGHAKLPGKQFDQLKVIRRSRTKIIHYGHTIHSDRTGCGRLLSEAYYTYASDVERAFPKCKHCFGHVVVWSDTADVAFPDLVKNRKELMCKYVQLALHEVCMVNYASHFVVSMLTCSRKFFLLGVPVVCVCVFLRPLPGSRVSWEVQQPKTAEGGATPLCGSRVKMSNHASVM